MEFAPDWLSSQGTEPLDVLDYLQHRYQFAEFQERIPFGTPNLDALFANPVQEERHREFLGYVKSLNKNDLGWVDLIMRPRPRPRVFKSRMQMKIIVTCPPMPGEIKEFIPFDTQAWFVEIPARVMQTMPKD